MNPEALKAELKSLLREPLMARGVSARYPTSGSKVIIDDLLGASGESIFSSTSHSMMIISDDAGHGTLLGAPTSTAHEETASVKKRPLKKKPNKAAKTAKASSK